MSGIRVFTLAGIPVWVSPWYLLLLAWIVLPSRGEGLIFAGCITLSLLAHELGHALVARHFKLRPQILLHGLGGVTGHERPKRDRDDALIVAAGPLAGLGLWLGSLAAFNFLPITSPILASVLYTLASVNLVWSVFNLLPLWPMDGGQLMRIGASKLWKPVRGERITHIISITVVVLIAVATQVQPFASMLPFSGGPYTMIILAMMAFQNVQAIQAGPATPVRRDNPFARELLAKAEEAYKRGDDDDAARYCHQLKGEAHVPPQVMARAWAILGVTATRRGEYREALSYLHRAPDHDDVVEAMAQCFYQLEMFDALEALVATRAFTKLPTETREAILNALSDAHAAKQA
jgi:stage IV sporulation protein FB